MFGNIHLDTYFLHLILTPSNSIQSPLKTEITSTALKTINTLRNTEFNFKKPKNEKLMEQQNFGKYSLFATFEYKHG